MKIRFFYFNISLYFTIDLTENILVVVEKIFSSMHFAFNNVILNIPSYSTRHFQKLVLLRWNGCLKNVKIFSKSFENLSKNVFETVPVILGLFPHKFRIPIVNKNDCCVRRTSQCYVLWIAKWKNCTKSCTLLRSWLTGWPSHRTSSSGYVVNRGEHVFFIAPWDLFLYLGTVATELGRYMKTL